MNSITFDAEIDFSDYSRLFSYYINNDQRLYYAREMIKKFLSSGNEKYDIEYCIKKFEITNKSRKHLKMDGNISVLIFRNF
jgi:hypothetical protein